MGNLGGYQTMSRIIKALGGPRKALVIGGTAVAIVGYGPLRAAEAGTRRLVRKWRDRSALDPLAGRLFVVNTASEKRASESGGLALVVDDEFRILDADGDDVLIEVVGRSDNPHYVSLKYLSEISNCQTRSDGVDTAP